MAALLFGRDEGFYYRASGAELAFPTRLGPDLDWRLFDTVLPVEGTAMEVGWVWTCFVVEIMALFERLHHAGNTIVLVTHEADVAAFARRTISIRDGKVEKDVRQAA